MAHAPIPWVWTAAAQLAAPAAPTVPAYSSGLAAHRAARHGQAAVEPPGDAQGVRVARCVMQAAADAPRPASDPPGAAGPRRWWAPLGGVPRCAQWPRALPEQGDAPRAERVYARPASAHRTCHVVYRWSQAAQTWRWRLARCGSPAVVPGVALAPPGLMALRARRPRDVCPTHVGAPSGATSRRVTAFSHTLSPGSGGTSDTRALGVRRCVCGRLCGWNLLELAASENQVPSIQHGGPAAVTCAPERWSARKS